MPNSNDPGHGNTERFSPERYHREDPPRFDPAALNEQYAFVIIGGRPMILDECWKAAQDGARLHREGMRFVTVDAFEKWHANNLVRIDGRQHSVATLWLKHPHRRQYQGLCFDPASPPGGTENGGYYNLWQGFAFEPDPSGSCSIFLDHLRTNVANGDEVHYRYILAWLAHLVQKPEDRIGIALVLRGKQGTGKTIVGTVIGRLIQGNYALVDNPRFIIGNFNAHMTCLILLQADEGFFAGDKQAEGRLKGLITSETQMIEMKGKDPEKVRNFVRLLVTSNSDRVVPAGPEERRFAVFDVGDQCMQNSAYFGEMMEELENGGYAALLHYLLEFDLESVDLRRIPRTSAQLEQKIASLSPPESWWLHCLERGWIVRAANGTDDDETAETEWELEQDAERVFNAYIAYCDTQNVRHKLSPSQFGSHLKRLAPDVMKVRVRRGNARPYVYRFPALEACREMFGQSLGAEFDPDSGDLRPGLSLADEEG